MAWGTLGSGLVSGRREGEGPGFRPCGGSQGQAAAGGSGRLGPALGCGSISGCLEPEATGLSESGLLPCSWQVARAEANWICRFGAAVYRKLLVPRTGWKLDFRLLA